eukprot:7347579-Prymnesium_polylepis.1
MARACALVVEPRHCDRTGELPAGAPHAYPSSFTLCPLGRGGELPPVHSRNSNYLIWSPWWRGVRSASNVNLDHLGDKVESSQVEPRHATTAAY